MGIQDHIPSSTVRNGLVISGTLSQAGGLLMQCLIAANCYTASVFAWNNQSAGWLDAKLKESVTHQVDWQFVVTHFPPWWGEARIHVA